MAVGFKVNIFANKWNLALKDLSIVDRITTTEWTQGQVKGDRVTISKIGGVTIQDYVTGTPITYDTVTSTEKAIIMNKQKLVAVTVEDIDEVQSNPDLMNGVVTEGTTLIDAQIEKDTLTQMVGDAGVAGNEIVTGAVLTEANIKALLLTPARVFLNTAKAPKEGRFIVVDPSTEGLIVGLDISEADSGLGQAFMGRTMGMEIYMSNELPANKCVVGYKGATGFGSSLSKVKVVPSNAQVGDDLQILNVYGSKVIKDTAVAEVTLTAA